VTLNTIDDDLCVGATAEFEIDGTGISTSQWNFGDGISLNLLNPSNIAHYYSQPGTYDITAIVTNIYGCSDTTVFLNEVIIHPAPIASFTTNTITADIVYPYFEFYDNSSGAINYYWSFGDNFWSNDIQPTHTYSTVGDYVVELTVSNEYSCYDVASLVVHVEGIVVHVPNAFTPLDYNGVNDTFKPTFSSTEGIEFYELTIYNRWGIKIFQTFDIDEAWIGNSKENPEGDANYYAQNDVYTYTVRYRKKARATDPQPDQIITGHVTIIR
jgi:PKD repeat protein